MLEDQFHPLADILSIPVDQARYVVLMFLCVPVAMVYRHYLHPSHTSLVTRHAVSSALGLLLCVICFEWDILILIGQTAVSYVLLHFLSPSVVQRYTMVWVMGTLCSAHIYRTLTDFGGYHLDFSGPMMIITQKLSLVAFAVHDGRGGNPHPLNKDQERHKLEAIPSLLEYFSYIFNFHSILIGPTYTMRQHLEFIDGSNLKPLDNPNQFAKAKEHSQEPSTVYPVVTKIAMSLFAMVGYVYSSDYALHVVLDPSFSFVYRLYLILAVTMRIKLGFYFLWILSDGINNAAGLGFSGYDALGNAKWDITTNIFLWDMEFSMSLRTVATSWNVTTSLWLRRVCYERVAWRPNHMSFLLSAFWHGFYPGYYACLIYYTIALEAAKKMRRFFNPFFTSHGLLVKWSYHLVTWFLTQIYAFNGAIALQLMWLPEVITFWSSIYFIPVWSSLIVAFFFPTGRSAKTKTAGVAMGDGKPPPEHKHD